MRFIVFGTGAIGGMLAGKLARSGANVLGIARGAHLEAIRADGLLIETPTGDEVARFPCVSDPSEIEFAADDVIILAMKIQDMQTALGQLRHAGIYDQAIVCAQNGVEGERLALRVFPNVYGMCVRMPTNFDRPGVLQQWGHPYPGNLDVGCYPRGTDATCDAIVAALVAAGYLAEAHPDVMKPKYEKLLGNLSNAVEAVFGRTPPAQLYLPRMRAEGEATFAAAGIDTTDEFLAGRPPKAMTETPIKGRARPGTSAWQGLLRGTGTIETDYLNGEIILLGRLHGVPTPLNEYFARFAQRMAETGAAPGSGDPDLIARELAGIMETPAPGRAAV